MGRTVIVIGGGASGMMAAIQAARTGAKVVILEHTDRVGKKILSTGNGKCNLTNLYQGEECYRSRNLEFPMKVIQKYPVAATLEFFEELGILPKSKNGYIYPNSEQASAVLDVLRMEAARLGIEVVCGCDVISITRVNHQPSGNMSGCGKGSRKENGRGSGKENGRGSGKENGRESSKECGRGSGKECGRGSGKACGRGSGCTFEVITSAGVKRGDRLILAAGSKAAPATGSDGSGYELAKRLGHQVITPLPALVQLRCREKHYKQLAGIRTEARLTLYVDGKEVDTQSGELQLTDYGISGIPTFQMSRYATVALSEKRTVQVRIDFLPQQTMDETKRYLEQRRKSMGGKTAQEWMTGLLNKKLSSLLLKLAGISLEERIEQVDKGRLARLLKQIKEYETVVAASNPYENAQICCGGVDTREINPDTMESRLVPGLYLAGELLDVDGICGGYNLQWAWSSGALAGIHAGRGEI